MTDSTTPFAAWLEATMQRQGLSQAGLAREVGVADAQVSRWRRGQVVPSVRYLQRLADTFGVPRTTLDRLAGYPVAEAPAPDAADAGETERLAERQAYEAWFGRLLEQTVPRPLWPAYAEACAALAEAPGTAYTTAQGAAQEQRPADQPPESGDPSTQRGPKMGFRD